MREPYQSGPPKAEGNQKAGSGQTDEGTSQGPLSYTEKPPGGAQGPLRAEQGRNRPGCPLTPGRPPRVGEAPRPPPPALQVVWRGCRLRRPQPPHLEHHAQEHQVPLTWHLCALTPRQGYPEASAHSSLRTQGVGECSRFVMTGVGAGEVEGLPTPPGLTTPSLHPGVGTPSLDMQKSQNPESG